MGLLSIFGNGVWSALSYIVPFLFVLTIVVFFHELGHFLVARWCGVRVRVFSIGFGSELAGFTDRRGTRWRIAAIPLGGYVKFLGDESAASTPDREGMERMSAEERRHSFPTQPVPKRAAIVAAGPLANFILAVILFAGVFMIAGRPEIQPRVDAVEPDSAAAAAGFQPGDLVVAIDGERIDTFADIQRIVAVSAGETLTIVVAREGREVTLSATPELRESRDVFGNTHRIGVLGLKRSASPADVTVRHFGPLEALAEGTRETWGTITRTLDYLGKVVIGRESPDQLGGPIRVAQLSGEVASLGMAALVTLTAILSVSIGLINLFPIPLLDGGHLVFYAIEAVRGRPLSERAQEIGFRIGLALVLMLMLFATFNDITQIVTSL